ncbi:MAG: S-adenosylhomocysteine deaminase [Ktedonobacterales bacterium]|jgi:5-methylthioadenosine/S-adenosylhomocysteine deaminase|nr:MAG: S-adenosylhomocysteine deaminase [Ktedonobacterales bacterium]
MQTPEQQRILAAEQTMVNGKFEPGLAVVMEGGKITRVVPVAELAPDAAVERFARRLLVPGTLNAHNHSFQSMLRGVADDCDFFTWRDKALYAYTPRMDEEAVYQGARFAFAEMIRNGVTTVCDFFYIHRDGNANDHAVIRAAQELGMRIVLARTMYDWEGAPKEYQESIADAVARTRELWQAYRGRDDVHVCPAPHSPHAASPAMIQAGSELAQELDTRFHIHVAEGRYERDTIREKYGKTPMRWLESLGLAMERMTAIHCVWLEDDDIQLMGQRDTRLVYNPASNMFLGDGVTRIVDMMNAGIKIGLGSDGGCSNNRVSVFDEMRMCALLQKVTHLNSEVVPAEAVFAMGTAGSADTLGIAAGRIEAGHYADFALLDMDDPSLQPPFSYEKNVVYAMTPHAIREVIVGGETVFHDGELLRVGWDEVLGGLRGVTDGWMK